MPTDHRPLLRVEVLGPLRVVADGEPIEVPGPKRRAVLALLAMATGRAVSVEHLLDAVWPADAPDSSRAALHSHISRLRGHLGPVASRLEAVDGGYRLVLEPGELDAADAEARLTEARALATREPAAARSLLTSARALWRGAVLADLTDVLPLAAWVVKLDELRTDIDVLTVECGLATGDVAAVVGVAAEAVAADPLHERSVLALMQALAAAGRAPDALRAAYDHRRRLSERTGLEPSRALAELERTIAASGTAAVRRVALPVPTARTAGRDAEAAALQRLLADERLVTIVGPGGIGKTHLAFDVARRYDDVTLLLLAPVTDPHAIPHALAAALGLEVARGDVLATCMALLGAGPRLLMIDNCEHVLDPVGTIVTRMVETCPELTILATSREPLGLAAERQCRLGPLPLPDPDDGDLGRHPAVSIFVDRAQRVRPEFAPTVGDLAIVAEIVRRLDGMPLAIELAAGRMSSFGLADLHDRLDGSLDLLGDRRGAPDARHRTLRSTLEWSYDLLPEIEQQLFRHLAVFPDGVDLATAETVASALDLADGTAAALAHLVDASMVEADLDGHPRYRMLETLRAFGVDRLEAADEEERAGDRFVQWAVARATWIGAAVATASEPEANAVLRREVPNLRAAWRLVRDQGRLDDAVELAVALGDASTWRDLPEIGRWAEELLEDPQMAGHPRAAAVFAAASDSAWSQGELTRAEGIAARAAQLAADDDGRSRALLTTAIIDLARGAFETAAAHALQSAACTPRPDHAFGIASMAMAYAGDFERAAELNRRLGAAAQSPTMWAEHEYCAGEIASAAGRTEDAERHYRHAIDLARISGATFAAGIASVGLLTVLVRGDRHEDALRGYRDVIDYWEGTGNWVQQWTTLRNLAALLRVRDDEETALFLEGAADHAPDAPARGEEHWHPRSEAGPGSEGAEAIRSQAASAPRAEVLEVARQAIAAHLESDTHTRT